MSEPLVAMVGCDAIAGAAGHSAQVVGRARRVLAEMLFLESPAGLNRVEIGRVWRQAQQADAARVAPRRHARALLHEYPVGVGSRVVGRLWP